MKVKFLLSIVVMTLALSQWSVAGSVKGKVTPGNAVVYLESASGPVEASTDKKPIMDQKGLLFQPHVMVVQTGTTVEFQNSDKVQHNVFWPSISGDKKKSHNMGTWPQGEKRPFKFTDPGVVTLLCNVHPEMAGYIIVSPTPYFAETGADGAFTLANVPDGDYTITAWHEGKKIQSKKITVKGDTSADFTLQ